MAIMVLCYIYNSICLNILNKMETAYLVFNSAFIMVHTAHCVFYSTKINIYNKSKTGKKKISVNLTEFLIFLHHLYWKIMHMQYLVERGGTIVIFQIIFAGHFNFTVQPVPFNIIDHYL